MNSIIIPAHNSLDHSVLSEYLAFTADTESNKQFHRWSFLSCVAAKLGRRVYFNFGHGRIYPNMYCLLVGVPAARKSTAIKIAKKLLAASPYDTFSYTRSSREKFLMDFEDGFDVAKLHDTTSEARALALLSAPIDMMELLNRPYAQDTSREVFICCDEFVDFIGQKNINFINTLTTLWDNLDNYPERLKNSKSVDIIQPTVNILGGITPQSFNTALPPDVIGQGFMSRVILVHGDPPSRKITFPVEPSLQLANSLITKLKHIGTLHGEAKLTKNAEELIDAIYQTFHPLPDARLQYYCARRLDHLLKLCMVIAALKGGVTIDESAVIEANTILSYTEQSMQKALGEFGEARNAKASQKVIEVLQVAAEPVEIMTLWSAVSNDLDRYMALVEVLNNLQLANKIKLSNSHAWINVAPEPKNIIGLDFRKYIAEYKI